MKEVSLVDILNPYFVYPDEDFYLNVRLNDIPETIIHCVQGLPDNCRKIRVTSSMKTSTELLRICKRKKISVDWYY